MEPYIEINTSNIIENYKSIKKELGKNIIAVIKDNAYGHGIIKIAQELAKNNVFMLCVSSINEAITLRKNFIFTPILLLGRFDDAKTLFSFKITPGISSLDQLKKLAKENIPLPFHLEIETGMNRLGIKLDELEEASKIIKKSSLKMKGIYTHFCSKEFKKQEQLFKTSLDYFDTKKCIIHCQSSNYINPDIDYVNTVRIGLSLYGYSSFLNLKPALKLFIPIWRVSKIIANERIGYDLIESAPEDGYILTLPIGYATAFSRLRKMCFYYKNELIFQIGKSCMDISMFFSKSPMSEGTFINFFEKKNIDSLLETNEESIYYLLSSLSPQIKRIYR